MSPSELTDTVFLNTSKKKDFDDDWEKLERYESHNLFNRKGHKSDRHGKTVL
jgi:hypothetical protein